MKPWFLSKPVPLNIFSCFKSSDLGRRGWERCDLKLEMNTSPLLQQGAVEMPPLGLKAQNAENSTCCFLKHLFYVKRPNEPTASHFLAGSLLIGTPGAFLRGTLSLPDWSWKTKWAWRLQIEQKMNVLLWFSWRGQSKEKGNSF